MVLIGIWGAAPGVVSSGEPISPAVDPASVFFDGLEPACPSSWTSAAGWTCADGSAPTTGNSLVEEPGDPGCPDGMSLVDSFCIDRFEASLALVDGGGSLSPWSPYANPETQRVRALSVRYATPQAYINQTAAAAACAEAGKRLCTDAEWLRACQGPAGWTYPWGDTAMPGVCNDARDLHPLVEYYGTTDPWIWSHLDQPCLNQLPSSLNRTGIRDGCQSSEGAMDLMGNLIEWTSDPAGTLRGGFYVDTLINGPGCLYTTTAHTTAHWDFSTGFRCCGEALMGGPGTI